VKDRVTVIGLGQIGIPTALAFAHAGIKVTGVDSDPGRLRQLKMGDFCVPEHLDNRADDLRSIGLSSSLDSVPDADAVVICIPLLMSRSSLRRPVPHWGPFDSLVRQVAERLTAGTLVSVETTVVPGTTRHRVAPMLEEGGLCVGEDVWLVHAPERLMPGSAVRSYRSTARVVGGCTSECALSGRSLYRRVVNRVVPDTCDMAEMSKLVENAHRYVNIAFANEVAVACDDYGINVHSLYQLMDAVAASRRFLRHGPGVGGSCLMKDTQLLAHGMGDPQLLDAAMRVNLHMPCHVADLVVEALNSAGVARGDAVVVLLGTAYRPGVALDTNSPARVVGDELADYHIGEIRLHDPHVSANSGSIAEALSGADCAVFLVRHPEYMWGEIPADVMKAMMRTPIIVDACDATNPGMYVKAGFAHVGVGTGVRGGA